nr:metal ABC transporter permease [Pseudomonadota bacterium]
MNLLDIFTQPFLARSLIVGLILSVSCGIIGSFIVVKKISSISGGLAHAAFGGIGLGFILNINPMIGAVIFCILCAFILGVSYRRKISGFETLISILWSTGMGLGMVFIALTPRYTPDPASYLFGNIVLVPEAYIYFALALNILILCSMKVVFKELHAISFDEEFAEISGLNVDLFFHYLLLLISLTIVV